MAAGERHQRIPTDNGPTEIRHLSSALDRMLEQQRTSLVALESGQSRLRQFIADASHELQTPITSVLGWTQLIRKALEPDGVVVALARIEAESRRMGALVDDLVLLARLDEHQPLERQAIDLRNVAQDVVADAHAVDPNRTLVVDAPTAVLVAGDPLRLRQVIDNLLRNARTHTPPGGHDVRCDAHQCVDSATDHRGRRSRHRSRWPRSHLRPLLAPRRLPHPLHRRSRPRPRDRGCHRAAHRGTIVAANRTDRGDQFTIELPTTAADPSRTPC